MTITSGCMKSSLITAILFGGIIVGCQENQPNPPKPPKPPRKVTQGSVMWLDRIQRDLEANEREYLKRSCDTARTWYELRIERNSIPLAQQGDWVDLIAPICDMALNDGKWTQALKMSKEVSP